MSLYRALPLDLSTSAMRVWRFSEHATPGSMALDLKVIEPGSSATAEQYIALSYAW